MKKLTKAQIDKQILDHTDDIVKLMKMKGFKDDSKEFGVTFININLWHDNTIDVQCDLQSIKTIRRNKK